MFLVLSVGAGPLLAKDRPVEIARAIPSDAPLGSTTASFLTFKLFDAQLWTERARPFSWERPFALAITYARGFAGEDLAEMSIDEIVRIHGGAAADYAGLDAQLRACLPDVAKGDRLTGLAEDDDTARLFFNGREICRIEHPEVTRLFFGIWLHPESRDASGRAELLGS